MFTAADACKQDDERWDRWIRDAVARSDTAGNSFLLIETAEVEEARQELERRGFRVYAAENHDYEYERLPFSWSNHRE